MAGKAPALPLVTEHLRTLRKVDARRISLRDLTTHYVLPAALGTAAALFDVRLRDATQVITGAAILAGFSFGLAVFVFQLRLQAATDPRVHPGDLLLELLDELFKNVCYLIGAGLLLVTLATVSTSVVHDPKPALAVLTVTHSLGGWWTGVLLALSAHYVVTLLMCIKRMRRAYEQLTI